MLVTHDSFALPEEAGRRRSRRSPATSWTSSQVGDGGTLTNELVLTKDSPLGDVAFGVDNTFASRALDEGVFAPYDFDAPAGVDDHALPGDDEHALTAVDNANVCVNVDDAWFAEGGPRAARGPRRPDRPRLPRPVRHAGRDHQHAGHGVPARHHRGVRRRLARLLGGPARPTAPRSPRAGRTPTTSTSPRVAAAASGRSCCPTTPRRRSPWPTGSRRPARCSTPASSRSSTPA